jgi:hypothetical protein
MKLLKEQSSSLLQAPPVLPRALASRPGGVQQGEPDRSGLLQSRMKSPPIKPVLQANALSSSNFEGSKSHPLSRPRQFAVSSQHQGCEEFPYQLSGNP